MLDDARNTGRGEEIDDDPLTTMVVDVEPLPVEIFSSMSGARRPTAVEFAARSDAGSPVASNTIRARRPPRPGERSRPPCGGAGCGGGRHDGASTESGSGIRAEVGAIGFRRRPGTTARLCPPPSRCHRSTTRESMVGPSHGAPRRRQRLREGQHRERNVVLEGRTDARGTDRLTGKRVRRDRRCVDLPPSTRMSALRSTRLGYSTTRDPHT